MNSRTVSDVGDRFTPTPPDSQDQLRHQLHCKITYIQSQIDVLPESMSGSHQYLVEELDHHQEQLLALMLQEEFSIIESTSSTRDEQRQ